MSIGEIVTHRQQVLQNINVEVNRLNRQFIENPMHLDTETINSLFSNLKEINKSIETKKQEVIESEPRKCCGPCNFPGVKKVTWITIGIEFIACALIGAGEIINFVLTQNVANQISDIEQEYNITVPTSEVDALKGLGIARIVFVVIAAGVLVPLISAVREIDNDKDKMELLMRVSELKEQGEEIQDFLSSFKVFKDSVKSDEEIPRRQQQESFTQCVNCLDRLPERGFKDKIPSRDHWISLMVQLLPEDHPIKIQLREMRDAALEQLEPKNGSAKHKHKRAQAKDSSSSDKFDDESSSSDSPSPRRKFRGERMPARSTHLLERRDSPVLHEVVQVQSKRFVREYQVRWSELEGQIGVRLNRVQLDNVGISRDASIAQNIIQLGAPMPIIRDEDSSSNEHEVEVVVM